MPESTSPIRPAFPVQKRPETLWLGASGNPRTWESKMTNLNDFGHRGSPKNATSPGGASPLGASADFAPAQDAAQQADTPATTLQDVPFSSGAKLTIERRGRIVLFGINRPSIQNRIDPELSKNWPKHITNMTTIPRCALPFYLATGRIFPEGSTLKGSSRSEGRASPGSRAPGR